MVDSDGLDLHRVSENVWTCPVAGIRALVRRGAIPPAALVRMHQIAALLREYDRARAYTDALWHDLSPDELTWRPHENSSAIGWHLGHQAHVAQFHDLASHRSRTQPRP